MYECGREIWPEGTLYLAQNAVHHPVDTRGTDAVGSAEALVLQMKYHLLDEGHLYMLRIGDDDFLPSLCIVQYDGVIGEDREAQLSLVAYQLYAILSGTLVTDETP